MVDAPRLTLEPPPKELRIRMAFASRMTLAVLVDTYGIAAVTRALDAIRASKKARGDA